jgi:hypothetical protein
LLSSTALSRIAERTVRQHGPTDIAALVDHLALAAHGDTERAEAGIRLGIIGQRLELDRGATVRIRNADETDRAAA